ncbi:MAG: hypothetical protein N3A65_05705 [candidate division WOR-3 bacterium]|nr:hypothetical protein [candidate division WOR-3 bacterium]
MLAAEDVKPLGVITAIDGDVTIYRSKSKEYISASLKAELFPEDSLITKENSEVTILYFDGKIASFGPNTGVKVASPTGDTLRGIGAVRGQEENPPNVSPLFAFAATGEKSGLKILVRAEEDSLALRIIEPGNTALMVNNPFIAWNKFRDANSYSVVIQKMGNIVYHRITPDTILPYPEELPGLEPGSYLLKVIALKGDDTLTTAERFIKILRPEVIMEINTLLSNIQQQNPDSFTLHFLNAQIFEEKGLLLNAIKEYEVLLKIKPDEPFLYYSLANLYNKYGLPDASNEYLDFYEKLSGKKK